MGATPPPQEQERGRDYSTKGLKCFKALVFRVVSVSFFRGCFRPLVTRSVKGAVTLPDFGSGYGAAQSRIGVNDNVETIGSLHGLEVFLAWHVNGTVTVSDPKIIPDVPPMAFMGVFWRRNDALGEQPAEGSVGVLVPISVFPWGFVDGDPIHNDFRSVIGCTWTAPKPATANDNDGLWQSSSHLVV